MKRKILLATSLLAVLFSFTTSASSSLFTPVPTNEGAPLRWYVAGFQNNVWSPLQSHQLEALGSVVYSLGSGLDIGLGIHGGTYNHDKGLFTSGTTYNWMVGGDVMLRFLGNVTEIFFVGIQATGGYHYNSEGDTFAEHSHIPVTAGLSLGFNIADVVNLYVFPEANFGGKTAIEDKYWGNQVGLSLAVGAMINLGNANLVLEAKPRFKNYAKWTFKNEDFATDWSVGLAWDI